MGNCQTVPLTVPFNPTPVRFEWQFQDEHGAWITYGQPNSAGNGSNATTTTSDDIENYFVANPNSLPVLVRTKHNRYKLDFPNMTEKNQETKVKRPIRRTPKQSANITPINAQTLPDTLNPASMSFEWQFQDEHGNWITYGKPNSTGNVSNATTTSSDDIEKHYTSNQANLTHLTINSNNNTRYVIDFVGMTQTNQNTSVQRPIRRIPKQPPNVTPVNLSRSLNLGDVLNATILHEWQFEDEHGTWITYGKPNSAGNVAHITKTCSDDIEKHYVSNSANLTRLTVNSKNNAQYVLDFKNMTQTNQRTLVQRRIRRVPKFLLSNRTTAKDSTFVWSQEEHFKWIENWVTSSSKDATSASITASDDIKTKYVREPTASFDIASTFITDSRATTQTNINAEGIRAIRRQLFIQSDLPSNWTPMNASDKGLRIVPLNSTDKEYINQVAFVKKTLPSNFTINKVFRVQNEHLWMDFVNWKRRLQKQNPQIWYKEVYLFHGTDPKHVQSICAENLDFRLNGTHGTMYGKGTYFATSAAYSAKYAGSGSTKLMFIVKVLVGHYTVGDTSLRRPPKDAKSGVFYDATVDNQANPTIYVKYDNTEYYPEYYIEFT